MNNEIIFSIVIPAFNEERYIRECLESISLLDFPKNKIEVIVVDNGSIDKTVEYASLFNVTILSILDVKVGEVRNHGARHSSGKYLAFLDSDCVVDKDWLNTAIAHLEHKEKLIIGGQYLLRENPSWLEKYWVLNNSKNVVYQTTLVGGCIFIRKAIFEQINGFNANLHSGEDSDLTIRLKKAGFTVEIVPAISVIHLGYPSEIMPFLKRQLWHSADYVTNIKKSVGDKVFFLTITFMLSFFSIIYNAAISNKTGLLLSLILFIFSPAVLTIKRLSRSKTKYNSAKDLFYIYLVDVLYLIGRVAGTCVSLKNALFKKLERKISR